MRSFFGVPAIIIAFLAISSDLLCYSKVVINEIVASNSESAYDEFMDTPDWIELYNRSDEAVNLKDYKISDKNDPANAWILPDTLLQPKSHMIIFASGKNLRKSGNYIIKGGGYGIEIYNSSDSYRFQYLQYKGDFDLIVTVNSARNLDVFGSAGIIMREDTTADSPYVGVFANSLSRNIVESRFRDEKGGYPESNSQYEIYYPQKLRIKSEGDYITTYYWYGGYKWQIIETYYLPINKPFFYIGLACTGADNHQEEYVLAAFSDLALNGENIDFDSMSVVDINAQNTGESYYSGELHTDFKLNKDNEDIYLWDDSDVLLDHVQISDQVSDVSYGRFPDGDNDFSLLYPATPEAANLYQLSGRVSDPVFSKEGGFYSGPVSLTLEIDDPETKIYYTLNGDTPFDTSKLYQGETISISKTCKVRARAFKDEYYPGKEVAYTFFVNEEKTLPVFSLGIDSVSLWDEDYGIFVEEFSNLFSGTEVHGHFEFWENGENVFSSGAGIKLHGFASKVDNGQKSLRLYSRGIYDAGVFNYRFWKNSPFDSYDKILLRNSGQDWPLTLLRDPLVAVITENMPWLDAARYRPTLAYINGTFWGIYNLRERIDNDLLAARYDVSPESINLIENVDRLLDGESESYHRMMDSLISIDMSLQESYDYMNTVIDSRNLIDNVITRFYTANFDWPGYNDKFWNSTELDTRWRWALYDFDLMMGFHMAVPEFNMFNHFSGKDTPFRDMFLNLLNNTEFRNAFINRTADLLNSEFREYRIRAKLDSMAEIIEPEIAAQHERWEGSVPNWEESLDVVRDFIIKRPDNLRAHYAEYFELSGYETIELNTNMKNAGMFKINSLNINQLPWQGIYFKDVPVTITVIPADGYEFAGWSDNSLPNEETVEIYLEDYYELTAIFIDKANYEKTIVINEIMYGPADEPDCKDWIELYNAANNDVLIGNWVLSDDNEAHQFIFPEGTWLKSGEYLVVCESIADFKIVYPTTENIIGDIDFGFGKEDMVKLFDNSANLIDSVSYTNLYPWDQSADGTGRSLELIETGFNNALPESWRASYSDTGTPGMANSSLVINEPDDVMFEIKAYPNPFLDNCYLNIVSDRPIRMKVKVLNSIGQSISDSREMSVTGNFTCPVDIDAARLPAGMYFIKYDIFYPYSQSGIMPLILNK